MIKIDSNNNESKGENKVLKLLLNDIDYKSFLKLLEEVIKQVKEFDKKKKDKYSKSYFNERDIFSKITESDNINLEDAQFYSSLNNIFRDFDSNGLTLLQMDITSFQRRKESFINVILA